MIVIVIVKQVIRKLRYPFFLKGRKRRENIRILKRTMQVKYKSKIEREKKKEFSEKT